MVIPVSVETQFRRLNKHLKELKQVGSSSIREEESIIVADICNACVLLLDKAMNAVWSARASKSSGKGKPDIYFPICDNREKLILKFQQYQLPNMEHDDPQLFTLIDSVQVYNEITWLAALHKLAAIRHERYPKINIMNHSGIGLGKGQDLYIESMTSDGNGIINFKGHGINRESGKIEPVRLDLIKGVRSVLEGFDEEPYDFCSSSVTRVKHLTSDIYRLLRGPQNDH